MKKSLKLTSLGFTLIELLGVLILLAVIALITYPIIDKVLSNAKNEAYERQKDSIIDAARMYVTANGNYSTNKKKLSFKTLIDAGFLKDGEILDPRDTSKDMPGCVLYNWSESKNQYIFEYNEECILPNYAVGDLLKVQVSDSETQNIYVLEVNDEEIIGILDRNLGSTVAWISEADYQASGGNIIEDDEITINQNLDNFGPITANKLLSEITSSWNLVNEITLPNIEDILKLTDFYKNIAENGNTIDWVTQYFNRLNEAWGKIYYDCSSIQDYNNKITNIGYSDILLPEWLTSNLYSTGDDSFYAYWTYKMENYEILFVPNYAWSIYVNGEPTFLTDIFTSSTFAGIRPIIHVDHSNIIN